MRKLFLAPVLAVVLLLSAGPAAALSDDPRTVAQFADTLAPGYTVQANLTYSIASNVEQKLDLYLPRNATGRVPLVIFFHGGGWVAGSKEGAVLYLLPYLQMGYAVASVGYRLGRVAPAPAAVEDGRCALRWLTRRAADFKLDTSKIILTGGSAGGHMALITAMLPAGTPFDRACATDDNTRWVSGNEPPLSVAAVINYYGITNVEDLLSGPNAKHYAIEWFGALPNREALARAVSPIHHVRAGVPAVITIHGDADKLVPYAHGTQLHEALTKAGVKSEFVGIPGGGHGGFSTAETERIGAAIRKFLSQQGLLPTAGKP